MLQSSVYFQTVFSCLGWNQLTIRHHHFHFVMIQIGVQVLFSLFAWQPGGSHCHVTNSLTFISQFINSCFNRKLKILFGLYIVRFRRE